MLLDRKLEINEKDGTVKLTSTVDTGTAARLASEVSGAGGGRAGRGSGEMVLLGFIPPEMWAYDPWLLMATKAARAGDRAEYDRYVRRFFELHPQFRVLTPRRVL